MKLSETFDHKTKKLKKHISEVEQFMTHSTVKIDIKDTVKIDATNLALEIKAPFIGDKKNSMADAVILLSAIDYLLCNEATKLPPQTIGSEEITIFPDSYFVSSNNRDFSSNEDKEKIHPDLEFVLAKTNTRFYYSLAKLINSIEEEFLTHDEEFEIEHADDSAYCDYCNEDRYPTISFSDKFLIPDEYKGSKLANQIRLEFDKADDIVFSQEDYMTWVRTATCSNCRSEYLECPCGELNHIESYNVSFSCKGQCGNVFIVHADIGKKGIIDNLEYEIIKEIICQGCGEIVGSLNDSDICINCEEKYAVGN